MRAFCFVFCTASFANALCFSFDNGGQPHVRRAQAESNKRVQDVKFFSKALQREMQYRVVLPKDYFTSEIRYPVLYLLHGLTGHYRSFEAHSNLTRYLERYQLIAVSIEGENSWYINSATNPKEKWEDYFCRTCLVMWASAFASMAVTRAPSPESPAAAMRPSIWR